MSPVNLNPQRHPPQPPDKGSKLNRFTLLVGKLAEMTHEGYLMESMKCTDYCQRTIDPKKAHKAFQECVDLCAFAKTFAEWHRKI